MASITADDGVRLHHTEAGDPAGRPVVLLAGFKASATSWLYQVGPLASAGYRVLSVDLRGHGKADRPATGVDMVRRGQDVRAFLDTLDLRDVLAVGGSMGGNTIWSYISQFGAERLAGIVVVDQTPKMLNTAGWSHGFYGYDESNVGTYFTERIPETGHGTPLWRRGMRLVRLIRAMKDGERTLTPGEIALLNDHARADWRPVIAKTDVPMLFAAGAESEFWPSSHAAAAASLAPQGSSIVIAAAGHPTNIEQPKAFNDALLGFGSGLTLPRQP
ncbi:alpha/beta fold hydrolase [Streptomyces chartreusis]